jgi:hypothetical protein
MRSLARHLRTIAAAVLLVALAAAPASAVTIRDLLRLKAAGLSDDVLIALIQTDGSVFHLTADDILALHGQGLSERVILAMIETARKAQMPAEPGYEPQADPAPAQQDVAVPAMVDESRVPQPEVRVVEVPVEVPVAVPVPVPVVVRDRDRDHDRKPPEPVYWGYGGQRRPDSWPATPTNTPPTNTPPVPKRRGG